MIIAFFSYLRYLPLIFPFAFSLPDSTARCNSILKDNKLKAHADFLDFLSYYKDF